MVTTKIINISQEKGIFSSIFSKIRGKGGSDLADLKKILSNEKARILYFIKKNNPESIYHLAKGLGRDFNAVRQDIRLLERFGFVELENSYRKGRERLKPIISTNQVIIKIKL